MDPTFPCSFLIKEESHKPPEGVSEISESDYFLRSDEFLIWLKEERNRMSDLGLADSPVHYT